VIEEAISALDNEGEVEIGGGSVTREGGETIGEEGADRWAPPARGGKGEGIPVRVCQAGPWAVAGLD
jgi:hypothetical protein